MCFDGTAFSKFLRLKHEYAMIRTMSKSFRFFNQAAETLAEVLIAMTVLAVGGGGAATLVNTSIRATGEGEARIVAYNIAREGVEAVRNVRDTNWIRFPGEKEECWDTLDATDSTLCALSTKINRTAPNNVYLVTLETDETSGALFKWLMIEDDSGNPNDELLYEIPIGTETLYTHDSTGTPTEYRRTVTIEDSTGPTDSMKVTSTVTWDYKGQTKEVMFVDELSNY